MWYLLSDVIQCDVVQCIITISTHMLTYFHTRNLDKTVISSHVRKRLTSIFVNLSTGMCQISTRSIFFDAYTITKKTIPRVQSWLDKFSFNLVFKVKY